MPSSILTKPLDLTFCDKVIEFINFSILMADFKTKDDGVEPEVEAEVEADLDMIFC
jgi:hypothetical protein